MMAPLHPRAAEGCGNSHAASQHPNCLRSLNGQRLADRETLARKDQEACQIQIDGTVSIRASMEHKVMSRDATAFYEEVKNRFRPGPWPRAPALTAACSGVEENT